MTSLPSDTKPRRSFRGRAGFTLIELLVVVSMIGILAALALVGYRKYIRSAQSSEALSMLQSIRVAQESFRSEALVYLTVSSALDGGALCPREEGDLNDAKASWETSRTECDGWKTLNAKADGPVRFGYATIAGLPGTTPTGSSHGLAPNWSNAFGGGAASDPWFIASAIGDRDDDGIYSVFLTASFTNEVLVQDDTE